MSRYRTIRAEGADLRVYRSLRSAERDYLNDIRPVERDTSAISRSPLDLSPPSLGPVLLRGPRIAPRPDFFETAQPLDDFSLREIQDGRVFHPDPVPMSIGGSRARVAVGPSVGPAPKSKGVYHFDNYMPAITCVRRKQRREVLFAKRRAGGGHRRPRRGPLSNVEC